MPSVLGLCSHAAKEDANLGILLQTEIIKIRPPTPNLRCVGPAVTIFSALGIFHHNLLHHA